MQMCLVPMIAGEKTAQNDLINISTILMMDWDKTRSNKRKIQSHINYRCCDNFQYM